LNVKGILVIAGIAAVILIVVLFPIKPGDIPPGIVDDVGIVDDASLEKETSVEDIPTVTDDADIQQENDVEFYIDENGIKHYIIDVRDVPDLEG